MEKYLLEVSGLKRKLPYVHISEDTAIASFVMIGDTELVLACAKDIVKKIGEVDYILTAEAKGIAFAYEVSKLLGHKEFIVARKSVKSYMKNIVSEEVNSITTQKQQLLILDDYQVSKIKGKKVCIIDDVISTGESLKATENLAKKAGAEVVCSAAVLAEGKACLRDDIVFLQELPIFKIAKDDNDKIEYIKIDN